MSLDRCLQIALDLMEADEANGLCTPGSYPTLRKANVARQREWDSGSATPPSYAGNELAGEFGEMVEAVLDQDNLGFEAVRDEIADVVICCDLIALRYDITLEPITRLPHVEKSMFRESFINATLLDMAKDLGGACNAIKKLERERYGMPGSRTTPEVLADHLNKLIVSASDVASLSGIDLQAAVSAKFNKTSEKVGLKTRLVTVVG